MDNIIVTNALAFVIGLFSSLVFWWILFFVIVPKVEFSEQISKREYKYNKLGYEYVFKLRNVGIRTILDVEFFARLRIEGLHPEKPGNFISDYIPVGDKRIPYIAKRSKQISIPVLEGDYDDFKTWIYPEKIQEAIKERTWTAPIVPDHGSSQISRKDVYTVKNRTRKEKRDARKNVQSGIQTDRSAAISQWRKTASADLSRAYVGEQPGLTLATRI